MMLSRTTGTHGWDDPWMVRVTWTGAGLVERYTAVDLAEDDTTPGVYPMLLEGGRLERAANGSGWTAVREQVRAWNDADAFATARSVYDAARGFSELRLPTDTPGAPSEWAPDQLRIEIGDTSWTFDDATAPAAARAVLEAARAVSAAGQSPATASPNARAKSIIDG